MGGKVEVLSKEYINAKSKLKCICRVCDNTWMVSWDKLQCGTGCPSCANGRKGMSQKLSIESVALRNSNINPNIKILSSSYINSYSHLKCVCKICCHEWNSSWDNLKQRSFHHL